MRGRRRMDEGATPPPQPRPSISRSHTGASSSSAGDISLETGLPEVSLNDDEEVLQDVQLGTPDTREDPSPPPSPSPHRNGRLPALDLEDDEGDITLAGSSSPPMQTVSSSVGNVLPETELQEVSLDSREEAPQDVQLGSPTARSDPSHPPSTSPGRKGGLPTLDLEDDGGDVTLASSSSPPMQAVSSASGVRSLTPSPSLRNDGFPSPTKFPLPEASTSTLSLPLSPRSPRMSKSSSHSPPTSPIPQPEFFSRKASVPASVPVVMTDESTSDELVDGSPFESIPLSTTPPNPSVSVPLPSSPRNLNPPTSKEGKRRSWNGFGLAKDDKAKKRTSWINGAPAETSDVTQSVPIPRNGSSTENIPEEIKDSNEGANGEPSQPKPRLHAPPAHPHPFPLPSTTEISKKTSSVTAPPDSSAGPSGGIGAKGLSAFDKIVNHTRPSHLPPKPKEEDDTHYHQWEQMMSQARENEKERRKIQDQRRLEKEKRLAACTPRWDALLNDPGFSVGKVKADQGLREMWFHGVPGYLRGKAWGLAIGNPLALSKDAYKVYVSRARKALDSGRFSQGILDQIDADMDRTLPQLKLFGRTSPMRADLQEFICSWVVYRSDEGMGYAPYVSHIAAMLMLPSPPAQAFLQLCNLLSRPCLRAFVTETADEIDAFYRVFENLQADTFPKIYANCSNLGLRLPEGYFRSMLVEQVPFEACCRLWDQIVLDGDGYIFRSALAIFGFLEPRLHYPDKNEILSVLEGRNKATLAITEREKERARLKGEAFEEELDGKLSVFGLNEDALFDWLASDGWRESRYERLVVREMPD